MKPEKAREIEDSLIRSAQMGAIASQIDEPQLVKILNDLSEKKTQTKVTVSTLPSQLCVSFIGK